jgi:hypothetical protein
LFFIDKEEEECSDSEGSEDESEEDSYDEEETPKTGPSHRLKSQLAKRKKDRPSSSDSEE